MTHSEGPDLRARYLALHRCNCLQHPPAGDELARKLETAYSCCAWCVRHTPPWPRGVRPSSPAPLGVSSSRSLKPATAFAACVSGRARCARFSHLSESSAAKVCEATARPRCTFASATCCCSPNAAASSSRHMLNARSELPLDRQAAADRSRQSVSVCTSESSARSGTEISAGSDIGGRMESAPTTTCPASYSFKYSITSLPPFHI
eukprot:scaffold86516_cov28-Tisochrysis_lutea.AAC.2